MFTTRLRFLTAGESHGPMLTAILEGLPAGLAIDSEIIDVELERRQRGFGAGPRMKIERDHAEIVGGVMGSETVGSPISFEIANINHEKWKGVPIAPFTTPRPGHADLTGTIKYGYKDIRPSLERASARETAARVAIGAVCKHFLRQFGIQVFGYVTAIGDVTADLNGIPLGERSRLAEDSIVRCPDPSGSEEMIKRIRQIMENKDTIGGILETIVLNLPPGLGSHVHWDRKLEARLGGAILGIQAIKGVEFGPAFENTRLPGTSVHDPICLGKTISKVENTQGDEEKELPEREGNPKKARLLVRPSNRAGGLEGGISTGQPLIIRSAMKPIATTLSPQRTVDLESGKEVPTQYERSDFCPVPRAVPIIEAMVSFILADALLEKLGGDSMDELLSRYDQLRQANLDDLQLKNETQIFWE